MKGRLRKLVLFVLFGAIVNVAVAWGFAIWPIDRGRRLEQLFANFQYYEEFGSDRHRYLLTMVHSLPGEVHLSQRVSGITLLRYNLIPEPIEEADFRALVPTWSRFAVGEPFERFVDSDRIDHELVSYDEYASGWPAHSLRYYGPIYVVRAGSGNVYDESRMTGYFHPPLPETMVKRGYRSELPFLPIWPGFALNTILYAAFLWVLTLGPFTARRIIRRKRGLCPKCGYDLRGTARMICSECGHKVRAEAGT
ncbi:MAG: hypothetical protein V3T53_09310 [Phycisphaerales bacterium]